MKNQVLRDAKKKERKCEKERRSKREKKMKGRKAEKRRKEERQRKGEKESKRKETEKELSLINTQNIKFPHVFAINHFASMKSSLSICEFTFPRKAERSLRQCF